MARLSVAALHLPSLHAVAIIVTRSTLYSMLVHYRMVRKALEFWVSGSFVLLDMFQTFSLRMTLRYICDILCLCAGCLFRRYTHCS